MSTVQSEQHNMVQARGVKNYESQLDLVPIDEDDADEYISPVKNRRNLRKNLSSGAESQSNRSEKHLSPAKGAINIQYEQRDDDMLKLKPINLKNSPEKTTERVNSASLFRGDRLLPLKAFKQVTPRNND